MTKAKVRTLEDAERLVKKYNEDVLTVALKKKGILAMFERADLICTRGSIVKTTLLPPVVTVYKDVASVEGLSDIDKEVLYDEWLINPDANTSYFRVFGVIQDMMIKKDMMMDKKDWTPKSAYGKGIAENIVQISARSFIES